MPNFVSHNGIWKPAKEKAVNVRTGDIYEGPDREATEMEKKNGGPLGMDVLKDPENIMRARQLGMDIKDFLELNDPVVAEDKKDAQKEKAKKVVTHAAPKRKQAVSTGRGGFGEAKI